MCRQHVESREMDIRTEYREVSFLSAVCPFSQLRDGINNTQSEKIQIVQRRQGNQLQIICKGSRKHKLFYPFTAKLLSRQAIKSLFY